MTFVVAGASQKAASCQLRAGTQQIQALDN
jgi:hypothetical protein